MSEGGAAALERVFPELARRRGVPDFLEDLDGVEYDGLFIFEENAYGFIPSECGAAFGIEQMNKLDRKYNVQED